MDSGQAAHCSRKRDPVRSICRRRSGGSASANEAGPFVTLPRLHALRHDFVQARQAKAEMEAGTFTLTEHIPGPSAAYRRVRHSGHATSTARSHACRPRTDRRERDHAARRRC